MAPPLAAGRDFHANGLFAVQVAQFQLQGRRAAGQAPQDLGRRRVVGDQRKQVLDERAHLRRGRDQPRLGFDPLRIAIVLRPGHTPSTPVLGIGIDDRIGARVGMPRRLVARSPTVGTARDPPILLVWSIWGVSGIGGQLERMEHAAKADIVGHANRFRQTTDPGGNNALNGRPSADAVHPYSLIFLELRLGHGF
ncbi:hypothetical protein [Caulobacter sp. BP25]|uniref:hypothetical protein n=1 Tax=Caulobacter sp. BP25 TaxID=2048900 RepID=UPI0013747D20|nr:hypothetical protein [Caulobacter sp. BP25]